VNAVGSAIAHLIFRVDRLPGPGETVLGEAGAPLLGGKGSNQAIAAALLSAAPASFHHDARPH
jgi:ribokinase